MKRKRINPSKMKDSNLDYLEDSWFNKLNPEKRIITGRAYIISKRILDLFLVITSIPLWFPLMLLLTIAIYITSSSPVFFFQLRTGRGGKRFRMYKFRSMVRNAEDLKFSIAPVAKDGNLAGPLKMKNDPRITPIGKFLRKTSLDELPQIFNVITGDMSIVGPRPTSWSSESYKLWHTERLDVLPGITGLWQVMDRGNENFDMWLRWDIRYIQKRSLLLDMIIIIKTLTGFLNQPGAR